MKTQYATLVSTPSGGVENLLDPETIDFSFVECARVLSRTPRFNGRNFGPVYSVAQHCVIGAEYIFNVTQDRFLAAAFLLHDDHEEMIGDIITPTANALCELLRAKYGQPFASALEWAIHKLKFDIDKRVLEFFPEITETHLYSTVVKTADKIMTNTERHVLFGYDGQHDKNLITSIMVEKPAEYWARQMVTSMEFYLGRAVV